MSKPGDHHDRALTIDELSAAESAGRSVVEIPLASYHNIVKFLRRAHQHRPNRDVLWCLRALDDYAPTRE